MSDVVCQRWSISDILAGEDFCGSDIDDMTYDICGSGFDDADVRYVAAARRREREMLHIKKGLPRPEPRDAPGFGAVLNTVTNACFPSPHCSQLAAGVRRC